MFFSWFWFDTGWSFVSASNSWYENDLSDDDSTTRSPTVSNEHWAPSACFDDCETDSQAAKNGVCSALTVQGKHKQPAFAAEWVCQTKTLQCKLINCAKLHRLVIPDDSCWHACRVVFNLFQHHKFPLYSSSIQSFLSQAFDTNNHQRQFVVCAFWKGKEKETHSRLKAGSVFFWWKFWSGAFEFEESTSWRNLLQRMDSWVCHTDPGARGIQIVARGLVAEKILVKHPERMHYLVLCASKHKTHRMEEFCWHT